MNITISGRHVEVTPAIEEQIRSGLQKLKKFFDGILHADVVLAVEKRSHLAEINLSADGVQLHGEAKTDDLYKSIDIAISRIQIQITRYKEKIHNHRQRRSQAGAVPSKAVTVTLLKGEDVAFGEKNPQIVRTRRYDLKPMSVDEAAMQMDLINQNVMIFMNDSTNSLNVLYRRQDGDYDLIVPEV